MDQITDAGLRSAITQRLEATHVEVTDMSGGCGQAFTSLIVSDKFAGLNSLKRHRLVNAALKQEIAAIHAWTAKCQTPAEYERDRGAAAAAPSLDGTVGGHVEGTTQ
ncbi:putative bolA-like protein [Escovopsis weberi]|uniref:Putative bolA-like protein n=1 Tax=Escovopsis weberi TaxID=150374 RepID=A0A0M8MT56_ESCWE|nr:putative bolA-like protein [Escovopsis weberi]